MLADFRGYVDYVRGKWATFDCEGWGGFVLKQKLKCMKFSLKEWHKQHLKNLDGWMSKTKFQF